MATILYQLGNVVGEVLKHQQGKKSTVKVSVDIVHGNTESDGTIEPTVNILQALTVVEMYYMFELELINSTPKLTSVQQLSNHIYGRMYKTGDISGINFDYVDETQNLLSCIIIRNSYIKFENLQFNITARDFTQPSYNFGHVPFYIESSTVVFENCKFILPESTQDMYCYILCNNANIQLVNCTVPSNMSIKSVTPSLVYSTEQINFTPGSVLVNTISVE